MHSVKYTFSKDYLLCNSCVSNRLLCNWVAFLQLELELLWLKVSHHWPFGAPTMTKT